MAKKTYAVFSPEIMGSHIAYWVKHGRSHEEAIKIGLDTARREYRKVFPTGKFPVHLQGAGKFYRENPITPNYNKWSAKKINDALDKIDNESSALNEKLIGAGRGHETANETMQRNDALSNKFKKLFDKRYDLNHEIARRYGPGAPRRLPTKNPISEKTAHKLRKASPRTFEKMTDEEIKKAVKVKKNPVRPLSAKPSKRGQKKPYGKYVVETSLDKKHWTIIQRFNDDLAAFAYAKLQGQTHPYQFVRVRK